MCLLPCFPELQYDEHTGIIKLPYTSADAMQTYLLGEWVAKEDRFAKAVDQLLAEAGIGVTLAVAAEARLKEKKEVAAEVVGAEVSAFD